MCVCVCVFMYMYVTNTNIIRKIKNKTEDFMGFEVKSHLLYLYAASTITSIFNSFIVVNCSDEFVLKNGRKIVHGTRCIVIYIYQLTMKELMDDSLRTGSEQLVMDQSVSQQLSNGRSAFIECSGLNYLSTVNTLWCD